MKSIENALKEKNAPEEEIKAFKDGASKYVKEKLLPNFKELEFYTGESMDPDGMYVSSLLNFAPIDYGSLTSRQGRPP